MQINNDCKNRKYVMNRLLKSVVGTFLLVPAILSSCNNKKTGAGDPGVDPSQVKDYKVLTIIPRKAVLNYDFPTTLQGQQIVEIRPRVEGIIEYIYVDEGAVVKKGQPLFRLDQAKYMENIRSSEANIKVAEADVNAAKMQVNKVRPLVEKDIVSRYELESAQYTLQARQANLAQAKANLANARTDLSYTIITSPADGLIGTIPYKIGALVNSNIAQPLATVANTREVFAYFSLNEKQLLEYTRNTSGETPSQKLKNSPNVFLILPDGSQYPYPGRIEAASGLINTETGSAALRATFPNPEGLLRSGGSGSIRIPVAIDTALLVPQKATYEIQGKQFVYLTNAKGKVRSVEIKVDPAASGQSFVVQGGIKSGDKVVVEGVGSLREGAEIKPVETIADSVYKSMP
jgi:membrane fusion protein (multidrug efflux system)